MTKGKSKECRSCKERKPIAHFHKDRRSKDNLCGRCKACACQKSKTWRSNNRKKHRAYSSTWQKENAERIKEREHIKRKAVSTVLAKYLLEHPCARCGEEDIVVLDFHHVRGKSFSISHAYDKHVSIEELFEEISKCQILCSNCHRRKTARDTNSLRWQYSKEHLPQAQRRK